ncbi:hypothetical protein WUBG_17259 [Wuchereria bancrofti]|uniref:Uncharacterized protein n=1 Tax=Wuchereria bancrofti TaxID=6293 RepID=J9ACV5_WUCBA|nr:hypothetical protein WUBG_17259 [Wuchereria bancrofti]
MFSDGEATPRASATDSNVASIEYDKDPINSTIAVEIDLDLHCCSPSPYTPRSSPQKDSSSFTTRQQQPRHIAVTHQQYAASPLSQQQSIRTPLSAPPTVHSQSQLHPTCGRIDDLRSSRSDGEATPRASATDSNVASIEYDKDPINSTIGIYEILFLTLSLKIG